MGKNYMGEIVKMLGLEFGEEFIFVTNQNRRIQAVIKEDGLYTRDGSEFACKANIYLSCILLGEHQIKRLPYKPKEDEEYWTISFGKSEKPYAEVYTWSGDDMDYTKLLLGMVYRTKQSCLDNLSADFKKLTGKELGERE